MTLSTVVDRAGPWVGMVLVGLAAFSAGHFLGPERVEQTFVDVAHVKFRDRWHKSTASKTTVTEEKKPDGSSKTVTVIDEKSNEGSESIGISDTTKSATTITTNRPDWRVRADVGGSFVKPLLPIGDTPIVIGVGVERRILGGISVGVWGSTVGAAGVGVSGEF